MKYIDADILKAEIERLDKHYIVREEYDCGWNNALNAISKFLDSLPEQPEGLEEAAEEYVKTTSVKVWGRIDPKKDFKGYMARANYGTGLLDGFIAGAEWQKKQDKKTIELAEDHAMLAGMNKIEQQIVSIIESRIKEIIGDAQPNPVLRIELQGIIDKIK